MGRAFATVLVSIALSSVAMNRVQQEYYESGPFKGFAVGESSGEAMEIAQPFRVGAIKGRVTYFSTVPGGTPLSGALVQIRDDEGHVFSTTSDDSGIFEILKVSPGNYSLMATKHGFHMALAKVVLSKRFGRKNRIDIQMKIGT